MDAIACSAIAAVFGRAIAEIAEENGELEAVTADLETARQAFTVPELRVFFANPLVPRQAKLDLIEAVFAGRCTVTFQFFLKVIVSRRRGRLMPEILRAGLHECLARRGIEVVSVTTAVPLDDGQKAKIREALAAGLGVPIYTEHHLSPALMGGIVIKRGDQLLDASVLGILRRIEDLLAGGLVEQR